ncbi:hypothetical protein Lalb_Chr13g0296411 [Lupinus albus]|uniref:Uncharacterized protein n=1 Tax=Lupinus albus TaxID=3870 RepID=A0A6A4PIC7_LUPAL|nr:hypothetical protein Lalb_Chr13g0296411 [Lupinus albus]
MGFIRFLILYAQQIHKVSIASDSKRQRESNSDSERLASARKRLQENYKEAANAKKQRMIQVMDLHELPKPKNKNVFFAKKQQSVHGRFW